MSGVYDFRRVAVHELGHALGLDHEDAYPSIVNPYYSDTIETPQTDDINGIRAIYGGLGQTWANLEAFVTRFYQECLGRNPDPGGLNGWVNALFTGAGTGATIAYGFVLSPEFQGINTTDQEYIYVLYSAFFNRGPDQAGYDAWLSYLVNFTPAIGQSAARLHVLDGFLG